MVDSISGAPVVRAGVQAEGWMGLAWTDSSGNFKLRGVPVTTELRVRCPTARRLAGRIVRRKALQLIAARDTQIVVRLPILECVEPPIRSIRGEFRGHYTSGFETSDFRPCNGLPPERKVFGEDVDSSAWVVFSSKVDPMKMKWPEFPDTVYTPTVYVRWMGTLTGPASYGHMGVATYQLVVDRILEIRKPKRGDCGARVFPHAR
ncbi:MAG TPA: hypothetical protein VF042_14585 [Gemmatimonadaceae bacterium]